MARSLTMPSCKSRPVPAFYDTPEPQALPMLSSQMEMCYQPKNPVAVSAKEEIAILCLPSAPAPERVTAPRTTNSRATTPRAASPITKSSGKSVIINEDRRERADSPSPSVSTLSSLDKDEESSNKIPKPTGEVGRPGRGGYNLEEQMGWGQAGFKRLQVSFQ